MEAKTRTKDRGRKWMWGGLGMLAGVQFYAVQELLAALALFALGFLAIALTFSGLYALYQVWAATVARLADSRHPAMVTARQSVESVGYVVRRPFRRPRSEQPAS